MDSLTQLWIRACKSKNPTLRLRSVCRRFYLNVNDRVIVSSLGDIVDGYCPMKTMDLLRELDSPYYQDLSREETLVRILRHRIAFTKKDKFVGMKTPLWAINKFHTQTEE